MDLSRILAILFRRWYAVLPVIILVVLAGYGEVSKVKTPYEATGKMLLLSPSTFVDAQGRINRTNPFTSFGGSLKTTAIALTEGAGSNQSILAALAKQHLASSDWQASVSDTDPIVTVTARSAIRKTATATASAVLVLLTQQLVVLQDSVAAPPTERITAKVIVPAGNASPLTTARNRALAGTLVLGILAVCAAGLAAESLAERRQRLRRHRAQPNGIAPSRSVNGGTSARVKGKVPA